MIDRRQFLLCGGAALAAIGAAAAPRTPAAAATDAGPPPGGRLIDVHHHVFPPAMIEALGSQWPPFSLPGLDRSLAEVRAGGTTTAMISFPNYDILSLEEPRLTALIRQSNDQAAGLVASAAAHYGLFASLPLPYVDPALAELSRALDELHADGILLLTSYRNRWLGDERFRPVLAELNRRRAVVFVHPAAADCCRGLLPGLSDSIIEYETDTARTIASLVFSGAAERFPDIRFIFSHAGGTLPALIERFTTATSPSPGVAPNIPKGVLAYLRAFHYDTAQAVNPTALGALLRFIPAGQVVFGTDFPYRGTREQVRALQGLGLGRETLTQILVGNAQGLFPRLADARPRDGGSDSL